MRVLGLDCATAACSVAIAEGDTLLAELFFNTRQDHSRRLLPLVDDLLRRAGLELGDLEGLAVAVGPGSFTGLRIGLATAKGLAHATGLPLAGVPSLDALAANAWGFAGLICPLITSRRGEIYAATYRWQEGDLCRLTPYQVASPEEFLTQLAAWDGPLALLGDAVAPYWDTWQRLGARAQPADPASAWPRAAQIARLGRERLALGQADDPSRLKPIYLHPPAASRSSSPSCP